jgi:ankyrin repeat protein
LEAVAYNKEARLQQAVSEGDVLLEREMRMEAGSGTGISALIFAITTHNPEAVQCIVEAGADVEAKGSNGNTALHIASFYVDDDDDDDSETSFFSTNDCFDDVKYLIEHGANVHAKNNEGATPLHLACGGGLFDIVKYLVESGSNLNTRNIHGRNALHMASCADAVDVVEYLVECNAAALEARDDHGCTALHLASALGNTDVVMYLSKKGSDANATTIDGMTALHYAVEFGHVDTMLFLTRQNECTGINIQPSYTQRRMDMLNDEAEDFHTDNNDVILALQLAISLGQSNIVKDLIHKCCS